jgi:hypothetical protein
MRGRGDTVRADDGEAIRAWLRPEHAPAYDAALEWLTPRCRTETERRLAPALLLLLAPLNALVAPCRPVGGSSVNFQVTLSRQTAAGPVRKRLIVRGVGVNAAATSVLPTEAPAPAEAGSLSEFWLDSDEVTGSPLVAAARVVAALLQAEAAEGE